MAVPPRNIAEASDNAPADGDADGDGGRQRKRGAELEQAILTATLAELACDGYGSLSIESVAARAQTGKASIYRRWPTKQELVFSAVCGLLSGPLMSVESLQLDERTSTRDALLDLLRQGAEALTGESGTAMRTVLAESLRDSEFTAAFEGNFHDPRKVLLDDLLARGVRRGEIRPDWEAGLLVDILVGTLIHRYLMRRQPATEAELAAFLDDFVMPAIRAEG